MKKAAFILLLFLSCSLWALSVGAANYFVTPSGSGSNSGADWNNAFAGFGGISFGGGGNQVAPGDTVWAAGGSYGGTSFANISGANGLPITLKRATTAYPQCTNAAGWSPAFDSQVVLTVGSGEGTAGFWMLSASYWDIDGSVSNGWVFELTDITPGEDTYGIRAAGESNQFQNLTFDYSGDLSRYSARRGIDTGQDPANWLWHTNLLISHCNFHGLNTAIMVASILQGVTIEYCNFWDNYGDSTNHENLCYVTQGTGVFRYNQAWNYGAEGFYFCAPPGDPPLDNWQIYGNLFHDTIQTGRGIEFDPEDGYNYGTNWLIYNNTFANMWMSIRNDSSRTTNGYAAAGGQIENNIFFNASWSLPQMTTDYNWYSGSSSNGEAHGIAGGSINPFINSAAQNYNIVGTVGALYPKGNGANLGPPFNVDLNGNSRGVDSNWDIGAFDFTNGTPSTDGILWPLIYY